MKFKNICVFCGSRNGADPNFPIWSYELGASIAKNQQTLVFGGGGNGLMGIVAQAALDAKGSVIGIIPHQLQSKEGLVENLTKAYFVKTMGERKQLMDDYANAYIVLPGGIGTLDELFDVWATSQTGFHHKPILIANWSGYYDGLISFLKDSIQNGFVSDSHFEKIKIISTVDELIQEISSSS